MIGSDRIASAFLAAPACARCGTPVREPRRGLQLVLCPECVSEIANGGLWGASA